MSLLLPLPAPRRLRLQHYADCLDCHHLSLSCTSMIRPSGRKEEKKKQERRTRWPSAYRSDDVRLLRHRHRYPKDQNTIIVEFGNNKNCCIPMQMDAIAASESPAMLQKLLRKPKLLRPRPRRSRKRRKRRRPKRRPEKSKSDKKSPSGAAAK